MNERAQQVQVMMEQGLTDRQIASVLDVSVGTVRSIRCRHGWSRRPSPVRLRRLLALARAGRSASEIARELGSTPRSIERRLRSLVRSGALEGS